MPARIGGALRAEAARLTAERRRKLEGAQRQLGVRLRRAGWKVREVVRVATPVAGLLDAANASRTDVLVIGARGTGGVARLLLGSVAEGAMQRGTDVGPGGPLDWRGLASMDSRGSGRRHPRAGTGAPVMAEFSRGYGGAVRPVQAWAGLAGTWWSVTARRAMQMVSQ